MGLPSGTATSRSDEGDDEDDLRPAYVMRPYE